MSRSTEPTAKPKRPKAAKTVKPLEWIDGASHEEIARALIASDPIKAGRVAVAIAEQLPEEARKTIDAIERALTHDPGRTATKMIGGALKGLFG